MKNRVSVFSIGLALLHSAVAQVPAPDALQLFASSGSQCAEMASELRKREAELEKQASRLEDERDEALREGGEKPDAAGLVAEEADADPELMEIDEEIGRLTKLAAANPGTPLYGNLMDSIQHLNFQRQKLVGSKPDEEAKRRNIEIGAANRRIAEVNARIEIYNALSRKFEEDVSRFKAGCSAR